MKPRWWLAIALCCLFAACGSSDNAGTIGGAGNNAANGGSTAKGGSGGSTSAGASTLGGIQQALFTPTCAVSSCHDATTHESNLDLSSATVSCAQLVGVAATESGKTGPECKQGGAKSASLMRVTAGDSANSFLYLKLAASAECVSVSGSQAGERMPKDRGTASVSAIAAVKQWIDNGASCD